MSAPFDHRRFFQLGVFACGLAAHISAAHAGDPDAGRSTEPSSRLPALVDQTPPQMINGIAIDEAGYLWIADMTGSQLLQLEAPGNVIVGRYGREAGVDGPDDLVLDHDFVYYTAAATLLGAVGKLDNHHAHQRGRIRDRRLPRGTDGFR